MKLCRYDAGDGPQPGIAEDGNVVHRDNPAERHYLQDVRLLAPVQPRKFLAIGLNYADHFAEPGMEAPEFPVFFNKQVTCVVGPDDDVHMPRVSSLLDYEGELAVVIGAVRQPFPEGLLKVGDVVRIEIEGIGELRNTVIEEPEDYLAPEPDQEAAWAH
jgi:2-keto-4-pentenoate hydratase/2-oxohepta-3-ene-1,7-dioic acid hydratase in catechol pathway